MVSLHQIASYRKINACNGIILDMFFVMVLEVFVCFEDVEVGFKFRTIPRDN